MATDLISSTATATSALYDATQETYLALAGVALDGQERAVRLTRIWIDESRRSAKSGQALLETLTSSWRAYGDAVRELATSPATFAGIEFPFPPFAWPAYLADTNGAATASPAAKRSRSAA